MNLNFWPKMYYSGGGGSGGGGGGGDAGGGGASGGGGGGFAAGGGTSSNEYPSIETPPAVAVKAIASVAVPVASISKVPEFISIAPVVVRSISPEPLG